MRRDLMPALVYRFLTENGWTHYELTQLQNHELESLAAMAVQEMEAQRQ